MCHVVAALLFIVAGVMHIKHHWAWYKGIVTRGFKNKSGVTLLLSLTYITEIVSGIFLLFGDFHHSVGMWHYKIGIVLTVVGILHFILRFSILRKSISNK